MNANILKWAIPLGLAVIIGLWFMNTYNSVKTMGVNIDQQWAQVMDSYKRRSDLIPQLAKVVKATAQNEKDIIVGAIEARSKATSINIDASKMTQEDIDRFMQAQSAVSSSLGRLIAVAEAYPQVKSNESFLKLQDEVAGSDNRISTERKRYNETVGDYNKRIIVFPVNLFGFEARKYFEVKESEMQVPEMAL